MTPLTFHHVTRDVAGLLLVAAALLVAIGAMGPDPGMLLLGAATAGIGGAVFVVYIVADRRLRQLVLRHDCRVCPHCLQPILHRTNRCPECGADVDMSRVFTAWRRFALRGEMRSVRALQRGR